MMNFRLNYLSLFSIRIEFIFSDRQIYWKDMGNVFFFLMFWTTAKTLLNHISNNKIIFMIPDLCNMSFISWFKVSQQDLTRIKTKTWILILKDSRDTFFHFVTFSKPRHLPFNCFYTLPANFETAILLLSAESR